VITADTPAMREPDWPDGAVTLVPAGDADALAAAVLDVAARRRGHCGQPPFDAAMLDLGPSAAGLRLVEHLRTLTHEAAPATARPASRRRRHGRAGAPTALVGNLARDFARPTVRAARNAHVRLVIAGARLRPRKGPFIRERIAGADPLSDSSHVAIYAHYDGQGEIHAFHLEMLRALREAGFRVTLVSNAERLAPASIAAAAPFVRELLLRPNIGYDFGAFRDALHHLHDLRHCEQLLLCNDSVYGPFAPLGPLLARAEPSEADVWGMTEGRNHGPHLQSYFLLLHRRAIAHPAFVAFWRDMPYLNDKFAVVEAGELRLSRAFAAAGLRLRALFPYAQAEACFRAAARSERPGEQAMLRALGVTGP
jgi:hypothetical protein